MLLFYERSIVMLYKKNQTSSLDPKLFQNPTSEYRGTPFWAWNCKVSKEDVDRTLNALKKMGMGGAHIHSRTGMDLPYLGKEFMEMVHYSHEKSNELGGLASLISKIPAKNRLADFPHYLMHRAEQLDNLYIFKNTEGTPENIRKFHPNIIVSSTGSAPLLPPIAGLKDRIDNENHNIYSILGMISHINDFPKDLEGKKVVVVGGGAVGLDVVEFFADRNADISIVEMMDQIGRDLDPVSKNDTKTMMKKHNVHQLTKTALLEVKDSSFLVRGDGEPYELPFEYGFVCLGMRAQGQLYQSLTEEFSSEDVEIMNIGDSQRARRIIDGTQEGRNILTILEQKGYL